MVGMALSRLLSWVSAEGKGGRRNDSSVCELLYLRDVAMRTS